MVHTFNRSTTERNPVLKNKNNSYNKRTEGRKKVDEFKVLLFGLSLVLHPFNSITQEAEAGQPPSFRSS